MDKIAKFLKKLDQKELEILSNIIEQLLSGNTEKLNLKKLKGFEDIYRLRVGDIRVIYRHTKKGVALIEIGRRNEKTYKK